MPRGGACGCSTCLTFLKKHWRLGLEAETDEEGIFADAIRRDRIVAGEQAKRGSSGFGNDEHLGVDKLRAFSEICADGATAVDGLAFQDELDAEDAACCRILP